MRDGVDRERADGNGFFAADDPVTAFVTIENHLAKVTHYMEI
jgi:hypothetical protein